MTFFTACMFQLSSYDWVETSQFDTSVTTFRTLLQRACVGGRVSSDDVEDSKQLQDVLHPTGILAAACLCLRHLPRCAQNLTALIG